MSNQILDTALKFDVEFTTFHTRLVYCMSQLHSTALLVPKPHWTSAVEAVANAETYFAVTRVACKDFLETAH